MARWISKILIIAILGLLFAWAISTSEAKHAAQFQKMSDAALRQLVIHRARGFRYDAIVFVSFFALVVGLVEGLSWLIRWPFVIRPPREPDRTQGFEVRMLPPLRSQSEDNRTPV